MNDKIPTKEFLQINGIHNNIDLDNKEGIKNIWEQTEPESFFKDIMEAGSNYDEEMWESENDKNINIKVAYCVAKQKVYDHKKQNLLFDNEVEKTIITESNCKNVPKDLSDALTKETLTKLGIKK